MLRAKDNFIFNCFIITMMGYLSYTFALAELPEQSNDTKPKNLPSEFTHIGEYVATLETRVENGVSNPVVLSPLIYHVYTDGIDIRLYCLSVDDESFSSYRIYRSDGIGLTDADGEVSYIAGVQASSMLGDVCRQISVTRESLVMVKIPPRSNRVTIISAKSTLAAHSEKTSKP